MTLNAPVLPDQSLRYRSSMIPGAWQTRPRTSTPILPGESAMTLHRADASAPTGYMSPIPTKVRSSWIEAAIFGGVLLLVTWLTMWAASLLQGNAG